MEYLRFKKEKIIMTVNKNNRSIEIAEITQTTRYIGFE